MKARYSVLSEVQPESGVLHLLGLGPHTEFLVVLTSFEQCRQGEEQHAKERRGERLGTLKGRTGAGAFTLDWVHTGEAGSRGSLSYCRTYVKAVRGGGSEERGLGRVLWDATSRGLC